MGYHVLFHLTKEAGILFCSLQAPKWRKDGSAAHSDAQFLLLRRQGVDACMTVVQGVLSEDSAVGGGELERAALLPSTDTTFL